MRTLGVQTTAKPELPLEAQSNNCRFVKLVCRVLLPHLYHDTHIRHYIASFDHCWTLEPFQCLSGGVLLGLSTPTPVCTYFTHTVTLLPYYSSVTSGLPSSRNTSTCYGVDGSGWYVFDYAQFDY